jgi:hypothetical protein
VHVAVLRELFNSIKNGACRRCTIILLRAAVAEGGVFPPQRE